MRWRKRQSIRWQRWRRLSWQQRRWLCQWWLMLAWVSLRLKYTPFKQLVGSLQSSHQFHEESVVLTERQWQHVQFLQRWLPKLARWSPWSVLCLAQALTAARIVQHQQLPCCLTLAIARSNPRQAHAWLHCGAYCVAGGHRMLADYHAVAYFISQPAKSR